MSALQNSTNFQSGIVSSINIASNVTFPTPLAAAGTGTFVFSAPNTFLLNLIQGTGNYQSTGILLFDLHIGGLFTVAPSGQVLLDYAIQATGGGTATSALKGSVIVTTATVGSSFVRIPCQLSDIQNGSRTALQVLITNNSSVTGTFSVTSLPTIVPVTYLPYGFQTS